MMRKGFFLTTVAAAAGLLGAGTARAACVDLRFDRFDGLHDFRQEPYPTIDFRVRAVSLTGCDYFITIDNGGAASFGQRALKRSDGGATLPTSLCLDAACTRHWKHFPEATNAADVLSGSFRLGTLVGEASFAYYPRLGDAADVPWGDYENSFTARLYEGSVNGVRVLRDTETVRLRTSVPKKIDLSLVSTGQPFDLTATNKTMDFGLLQTGKEMGFDVLVKFNAGYRLKVSSQNNGRLRHRTQGSALPYTLYLNGVPLALEASAAAPLTVSQGAGTSPAAGLRLPGRVVIGDVSRAPAGAYEDRVTLTVSTTE